MRDAPRRYISAKFLLAAPPPAETIIPKGFVIKTYPARVAHGATKPRSGACGGAQTTGTLRALADRRVIQGYAARR